MKEEEYEVPKVSEWFGIEPLSSIAGLVSVVRGDYPIKPFMSTINWAKHRFYVNRFAQDFETAI